LLLFFTGDKAFYISDITISGEPLAGTKVPLDVSGGTPVPNQHMLWFLKDTFFWVFLVFSILVWRNKLAHSTRFRQVFASLFFFLIFGKKILTLVFDEKLFFNYDTFIFQIKFSSALCWFLGILVLYFSGILLKKFRK